MNQQLTVRLVPRHTLQMRFFLILAQSLQACHMLKTACQTSLRLVFSRANYPSTCGGVVYLANCDSH